MLDEREGPGEQWRRRWDSLRLFTPARFDGLPGRPYPAEARYCPTGAEFADYLAQYADQIQAPLHQNTRVTGLTRQPGGFTADTDGGTITARRAVVATGADRVLTHGAPLVGLSASDLGPAGARRGPRLVGVRDGMPELADGRSLEVDAALWATGFRPGLDWIEGLELDEHGLPTHDRGLSTQLPGLAFLGLPFQFGLTSTLVGGADRDAHHLATRLAA